MSFLVKRRKNDPEWYEDASFWETYAPIMFDEARWAEVPAVVDAIEALARPPRGAAVLDACCGPGRHSIELALRGYHVIGIDITESYLEAARESASAWSLDREGGLSRNPQGAEGLVEFIRADLRTYRKKAAFDLALNLYTSFGYFRDPRDDLRALRALRKALKPGGALVLEMNGKETAARDFVDTEEFERGGWTIRTEYKIVGSWEGLCSRWILSKGGLVFDRSFVVRLYSGLEIKRALGEAGFTDIYIFGGLDGSPYDQNAKSLVALASYGRTACKTDVRRYNK